MTHILIATVHAAFLLVLTTWLVRELRRIARTADTCAVFILDGEAFTAVTEGRAGVLFGLVPAIQPAPFTQAAPRGVQ